MTIDPGTAALRLGLALIAGAFIGIEREWRQKHAGVKTNALVAIGAAGFALVSGPDNRIAANIVTGIGFIGAGVILHRGVTVQGVTTAATLWANAAMSVCLGMGQMLIGGILFAGVMVIQFVMRSLDKIIARARRTRVPTRVELVVDCDEAALPDVNATWARFAEGQQFTVLRRTVRRGPDHVSWRAQLVAPERTAIDLTPLEERLVPIAGVTRVEARHAGFIEE